MIFWPLDHWTMVNCWNMGFFVYVFGLGPMCVQVLCPPWACPSADHTLCMLTSCGKRDYVTWAAWWFVWRSSYIVSCASNEQNRYIYIYIYSLTATREAAFDCHVRLTHCSVDETIVLWLLFVWAVFFFLLFISHCNSPIVCWYTFLAFYIRSLCPRVRSYPNEMLFRLLSI